MKTIFKSEYMLTHFCFQVVDPNPNIFNRSFTLFGSTFFYVFFPWFDLGLLECIWLLNFSA